MQPDSLSALLCVQEVEGTVTGENCHRRRRVIERRHIKRLPIHPPCSPRPRKRGALHGLRLILRRLRGPLFDYLGPTGPPPNPQIDFRQFCVCLVIPKSAAARK
jgi:hypothetical protein